MTAMEDLRANKLAVVIIAAVVGSGAWFFLAPSSVACNSPELIGEFQRRFQASREKLAEKAREKTTADDKRAELEKSLAAFQMNIQSTTTLGKEGNMLRCEMTGDYGAEGTGTFDVEYSVGRDDSNSLVWRFKGMAPYDVAP